MLTLDEARSLDHETLVLRSEATLAEYDRPQVETQPQKLARIDRTLDEIPQVYRWFLQLQSFFDYWTDNWGKTFGMKSEEYKRMRQRRDHFARMASAAKLRYEAASRLVTTDISYDPTGLPRTRRTP